MKQEKKKISIIVQVAILFLIGILTTGIISYATEQSLTNKSDKKQTEFHAEEIAEEAKRAVMEYPAYKWLIQYWYEHPYELDIEYDTTYTSSARTLEKARLFAERHPDLQPHYLYASQLVVLPEEDQKLYAEIVYSWLITRINQIKQSYHVDYLFCVISEDPFTEQFFLFSGAEPGAVRGTKYEEIYPLGNVVSVAESQTEAMLGAIQKSSHLADAGDYVDYYTQLCSFHAHHVLIGLTYDLSALLADIQSQTRTSSTLAILNYFILSMVCLGLLFVFVLRPLKKVQTSIRGYEHSKNSQELISDLSLIRSRNEIGQLSEDVTEMVRQLDAHMDQIRIITAEKERIGTELELAKRIQASMLPNIFPPFPEKQEFDVYASMDPAKEVGGDFYDFFLVDDDHLAMVIADVSGKGIPAALFMMISKIMLQDRTKAGLSPAEVLEHVNNEFCANNPEEMFVTVWLGILELSTGKLTAANAGHEYPVLMQPGGSFAIYKDKHDFVIGGIPKIKYRNYDMHLEHGSKLFVYTDGVPEAMNSTQELFGTERMLTALNDAPNAAPKEILLQVRKAVDAFVGQEEQFDDLTMLCLEFRGTTVAESKDL